VFHYYFETEVHVWTKFQSIHEKFGLFKSHVCTIWRHCFIKNLPFVINCHKFDILGLEIYCTTTISAMLFEKLICKISIYLTPFWQSKATFLLINFLQRRSTSCSKLISGSEIALSWSPMWRISQLVTSGWWTMLFHPTIITQKIALIFSQIDQNKIQSCRQLVTSFLHFHCFGSIKPISFSFYCKSTTDNVLQLRTVQSFAAMFFFSGFP